MSEHEELSELLELEARLRDLPRPTVPPGLEGKLLDAIPESASGPIPSRALLWKRIVPAAAAVAATVAIAILLRESPVFSRRAPRVDMRATSPEYVLAQKTSQNPQETNPWNILPTLPKS
ncbi:MAG TPA: hypothetical protein PKY77_20650 [Phycisphaerae bacterium]|nr:hypothetical protein [Phycisphaerae bacterium]HRY70631.1 hypothetical protein [Phycisphaerae bacterium]HSA28945.1 hypothetical protein [Phycisphaerae bacterium]